MNFRNFASNRQTVFRSQRTIMNFILIFLYAENDVGKYKDADGIFRTRLFLSSTINLDFYK